MTGVTKTSTKNRMWEYIQELENQIEAAEKEIDRQNGAMERALEVLDTEPEVVYIRLKKKIVLTAIEKKGHLDPQFKYGGRDGRPYPPKFTGPRAR